MGKLLEEIEIVVEGRSLVLSGPEVHRGKRKIEVEETVSGWSRRPIEVCVTIVVKCQSYTEGIL